MSHHTEDRILRGAAVIVLLAALVAVLVSCQPPDANAALPDRPELSMEVQEVSDTVAVVRASWTGAADRWRYRVDQAGISDTLAAGVVTDTTALDLNLDRTDSSYDASFCIRGENIRGSQVAAGPEDCGTVTVPPRPLQAPPAPGNLQVEIDTAQVAVMDSVVSSADRLTIWRPFEDTTARTDPPWQEWATFAADGRVTDTGTGYPEISYTVYSGGEPLDLSQHAFVRHDGRRVPVARLKKRLQRQIGRYLVRR